MFFSSPGTLGAAAESSCSTSTAIPAEVGGLNAPSGSQPRCATHRKIGDLIGLYSYRDMKIDGHVGYQAMYRCRYMMNDDKCRVFQMFLMVY